MSARRKLADKNGKEQDKKMKNEIFKPRTFLDRTPHGSGVVARSREETTPF